MKKLTSLAAFFLTLLVCSATSDAAVIIYKGTGAIVRGNDVTAKTVSTTLFFILDPATFEGRWIFAQSIAGAKTIFDDGSRQYGLAADIQTSGLGSAYYAHSNFNFTDPDSFDSFCVRLGGKKAEVVTVANQAPVIIAKTMKGSYSFINGVKVVDGTVSVTVDVKRTQTANQNALSVVGAANVILNEYTAPPKNYQLGVPNP
jgi:hypothetical protein